MVRFIDITQDTDRDTASSGATTPGTLVAAFTQINASDLNGDPCGSPEVRPPAYCA